VKPALRYVLIVLAVYIAGTILGIAIFKTPDYSAEYKKKFGAEHARFVAIETSDAYKLWKQRPNLNPPSPVLEKQIAFVEEYEKTPELHAERARMAEYVFFFRILNTVIFCSLLVYALKGPALGFLDGKIAEIRTAFAEAEKARLEGQDKHAKAKAQIDTWSTKEEEVRRDNEAAIQRALAEIEEEARQARLQLEKATADRKEDELLRAEAAMKEEMVTEALDILEKRYRTEATVDQLRANVDQFAKLMERLT
jgi:F0F1-type ATP synthase membrane subunit b/b'